MSTITKEKQSEKSLSDEVYQISEATNEDGTIDAEITSIEKVEQHGQNKAEIEFDPKLPSEGPKTIHLDWPVIDDSNYRLVQLCEETIGSFAALPQMHGETISVNPESWSVMLESDFDVEEQDNNTDNTDGWSTVQSVIALVSGLGAAFGIMAALSPFVLLLLIPWGVSLITFWQAISLIVGGGIIGISLLSVVFALVED